MICVPGPDTALTVSNALAGGRRCGVATSAGDGGPSPARGRPGATPGRGLGQGLVSNLANPKMAAFFLSLLPQFADPGSGAWGVLGLGLVFCLMTFAWLAFYSVAVDRARAVLAGVSGVVLVGFGARLALQQR